MPQKTSDKMQVTKNHLQEAFLDLCEQKPIAQIHIKELTDLAGYNRGTFYLYYQDIYDLREQIEEEYIVLFESKALPLIKCVIEGKSLESVAERMQFLVQNRRLLGVLLSSNGDATFTQRLINLTKDFIAKTLSLPADNDKCHYTLEYISYAHIGFMREWLVGNIKLSPEELLAFFLEILHKGPMTVLIENNK